MDDSDNDKDWRPVRSCSSSEDISDDSIVNTARARKTKNTKMKFSDGSNNDKEKQLILSLFENDKENSEKEKKDKDEKEEKDKNVVDKDEDEDESRKNWTNEETRQLIRIIEISHVMDLFDQTGLARKNVFNKVSRILKKLKIERSASQCSAKWGRLKKAYNLALAGLKKSGSGVEPKKKFKWFENIHSFMATRPCSALKGVESVKIDDETRKSDSDPEIDDESNAQPQTESLNDSGKLSNGDSKTRKKGM